MPCLIDSRFPRLYTLDSARVPEAVADFARRVCVQCRCEVAFDIEYEQLHFYYENSIDAGILQLEAIRPDGSIAIYKQSVQDIVEWIQRGKIERAAKDRIEARNKAAEKAAAERQQRVFLDERRPDALHYAAFLGRRRRGLGQRIFV